HGAAPVPVHLFGRRHPRLCRRLSRLSRPRSPSRSLVGGARPARAGGMKKLFASLLLLAALPAQAAAPPKPSIKDWAQLPVETVQPYNEAANADAQVAAAFARAQKSKKRVLIDLGGNWCVDCIVLANFVRLPEMRRFMEAHY